MRKRDAAETSSLAPALAKLATEVSALFGFDATPLLKRVPEYLGREPRADEPLTLYLLSTRIDFPGHPLGHGRSPPGAPPELALVIAAHLLDEEVNGTIGESARLRADVHELSTAVRKFSSGRRRSIGSAPGAINCRLRAFGKTAALPERSRERSMPSASWTERLFPPPRRWTRPTTGRRPGSGKGQARRRTSTSRTSRAI